MPMTTVIKDLKKLLKLISATLIFAAPGLSRKKMMDNIVSSLRFCHKTPNGTTKPATLLISWRKRLPSTNMAECCWVLAQNDSTTIILYNSQVNTE